MPLTELLLMGVAGLVGVFFIYFTLSSHNVRVLVQAAIPKLRNSRAINIDILKNGDIIFDLVKVEGNKLLKYGKEDGRDFVKNREITPGTKFIDPSSNAPIYFTVTGNSKTFNPTTNESQTEVNEMTAMKMFELGQDVEKYHLAFEGKKDVAGFTVEKALIVVVLVLVFVGMMLFSMNNILLEIAQAVTA